MPGCRRYRAGGRLDTERASPHDSSRVRPELSRLELAGGVRGGLARAERLGWDWAFIPVNPLGQWDPYVLLAFAAGRTSRIGLGTLLENVALDNPASIACSIATVAELAPGRALLTEHR
jgi:alkanesulfonate monooxygenase SsuD/methylene tetrahydromethanopterin reductase-like flavin-dependent oxidoreductase (luciferase family)